MVVLFVLAAVVAVGAWLAHSWANVLARVHIQDGRPTLASGALPRGVLSDIGQAARLSRYRTGQITVHRGGKVRTSPRDEGLEQRIRNVAGSTVLGKLHTRGDGWVEAANRTAGWMALNAVLVGVMRRLR